MGTNKPFNLSLPCYKLCVLVNCKNNSLRVVNAICSFIILIPHFYICDMIKRNESDVRDVVFEILAKTMFKFLCFILFLALSNPS